MDDAVRKAIEAQINHEFHAAYLYLAMAGHFKVQSLDGFGQWMLTQAQEEVGHAMRLFDFLVRRGVPAKLSDVAGPVAEFGEPLSIFEQALEHEMKVSALIASLYELAVEKKDHPTQLELQWFVTEQVEEEVSVGNVVEQLRMVGDSRAALLMLDQKLGTRATAK